MFKTFKPDGLIGAAVLDLTSSPVLNQPLLNSTIADIKAFYATGTPRKGCAQAIKSITHQLMILKNPDCLQNTLVILGVLYKECGTEFREELGKKEWGPDFTQREELRGYSLEMIAEWGLAPFSPESIKIMFERMLKLGYRFQADTLKKISPQKMQRIRLTDYRAQSHLPVPSKTRLSAQPPPPFSEGDGVSSSSASENVVLPAYEAISG
ncbi:hypothetical protein BDR26DRAFT_853247 [Obelidium mucronatum]|nr:hypothetical protein BDR26DRAFT_853247 [Obelidium mucronatum]